MLHGLVDTIADIWSAPDRWIEAELAAAEAAAAAETARAAAQPEAPEPEIEDEVFRARFLGLARTRQRQHGPVVCGLLSIVWPGPRLMAVGQPRDQKALTAMVGESVLNQMAGEPDCFAQRDENTYLLCFASGNAAVAELRATMMAQALRAALVRALPNSSGTLRVDRVVSEIDPVELVLKHRAIAPGLARHLQGLQSQQVAGAGLMAPRAA